jgi:hypothetical protein
MSIMAKSETNQTSIKVIHAFYSLKNTYIYFIQQILRHLMKNYKKEGDYRYYSIFWSFENFKLYLNDQLIDYII